MYRPPIRFRIPALYYLTVIISPFAYIATYIPHTWRRYIAITLLILAILTLIVVSLLPHRTDNRTHRRANHSLVPADLNPNTKELP